MSADTPLVGPEYDPLIARTEIRDVWVASVSAKGPAFPIPEADVGYSMTDVEFHAETGSLLVRLETKVNYLAPGAKEGPAEVPEASGASDDRSLAQIRVVHVADLRLEGDPEAVTREQIDELMASGLLFMMFPYVRATIHQLSIEMRLPVTVLPYLRRNDISSQASDPVEGNAQE